jgi:hypothetical protein
VCNGDESTKESTAWRMASRPICWSTSCTKGWISVRFSFNRDGQVVGQPLITYGNPQPSEESRTAVRDAIAQALARCAPLPLSDEFRKVISVHPITVRLGEGWRRRGQPAAGSEPQAAPVK